MSARHFITRRSRIASLVATKVCLCFRHRSMYTYRAIPWDSCRNQSGLQITHLYLFPVFGRKRPFQMLVGRLVCAVSATFYLAPPPRCSCSFRPSPPSSSLFRARVAHSLLLLPQYRVVLGRFRFLRNRNWNGLSTRNYLSSFAFLNFCIWHKEPQSRDF